MSPRTLCLPLVVGVLLLSAACGAPPESLPTGPPLPRVNGSLPAGGLAPSAAPTTAWSAPVAPATLPGYGTLPPAVTTRPAGPTTPAATSPSPTPSHAARCAGEPTGAQVIDVAKKEPAVPDSNLTVVEGPYCAGVWSFTTIGMTGAEPLSVVTTGTGAALALVTAGTDVCNPRVKAEAPPGIRVLACGY